MLSNEKAKLWPLFIRSRTCNANMAEGHGQAIVLHSSHNAANGTLIVHLLLAQS